MKEAWESSSRTADGFYSTTTPMSVYARICYEEGCKLENELAAVTAQRDMLAEALGRLEKTAGLPALQDDPARVQARQALQSLTPKEEP
jgi:hypothetical protein